ncbi:hypothetical protein BJY24_005957 [Nocardia transvalensis]|uniref:Uncharacterized protein n=1 Tax=Nocardia transvalensis TaxID=37333 RepID=A0A7W9PJ50_9NOCA|nr:hypothetical protein [Nocardia transvalensis]MBB5917045.1 hypothetical protein [Nocardia transvalensis]
MTTTALLGAAPLPLAVPAPTTTTTPPPTTTSSPTGGTRSCPTTPTVIGEFCPGPDPTLNVPSTAERGTRITVSGNYWRCATVRVTPSWTGTAEPATVYGEGSFEISFTATERVAPGQYSIRATCGEASKTEPITITVRSVPSSSTTTRPKPPPAETTTQPVPETSETEVPITTRSDDDPQRDNTFGTVLAVVAFLLAAGVAALVLRRRRGRTPTTVRAHHQSSHPPQVHVQVVADTNPSIRVREFIRPTGPVVRVRMTGGEPHIRVREVPR